ncbi:putative sidestep-like, partial [Homarus americanus]
MDDGGAAVVNELQLGPLTRVSIVGVRVEEVTSVWAEEQAEVKCRVWGSRPPPTVVWWLGSVMLPPTHTK